MSAEQYPADPSTSYQPSPQPQLRQRPLGVTILAVLEILGGVIMLIVSGLSLMVSAIFSSPDSIAEIEEMIGMTIPAETVDNFVIVFMSLGVIGLVLTVLLFVLAWAFLKGKSWARILAIALLVLSVIGGIVSAVGLNSFIGLGISIVIPVLIVVYMNLPNVKQWFTA